MSYKKAAIQQYAITLLVSASLIGCSGGGSNNTSEVIADPTFTGISVSGTTVKGVINNGVITAEELNTSGSIIGKVGSARTNEKGRYELSLNDNYQGGPILVTISTDEETTMRCDVISGCGDRFDDDFRDDNNFIDFGEWYIPSALSMSALLPVAASNETVAINITPFTHLASQYALALGNVDTATVASVNSEVANLIGGIDILNTAPVDITDSDQVDEASAIELAYAALSSAIANLATKNQDGEPEFNRALQTLTESFSGGLMIADDTEQTPNPSSYSLKEIRNAAQSSFDKIALVDISLVLENLDASIDSATDSNGDGIADVNPEPSSTADYTNLAKTKALMADLRTWGMVIRDDFQSPGKAFRDQIRLASNSSQAINDVMIGDFFYLAARAIENYNAKNAVTQYEISTADWPNGFSFGTLKKVGDVYTFENIALETFSISDIHDYNSLTFKAGRKGITEEEKEDFLTRRDAILDKYLMFNMTVLVSTSAIKNDETTYVYSYGITSGQINGPDMDATFNNGLMDLYLSEEIDVDAEDAEKTALSKLKMIELELDLSLTQKWDLTTTGTVTGSTGSESQVNVYDKDPVTFSGSFRTVLHPIVETNTESGKPEVTWLTPSSLEISGSSSNEGGDAIEASFAANFDNALTFQPVENENENQHNWIQVDASPEESNPNLGLSFSLELEGLPEASVTLIGDRTGFEAGDVTLTIAFDNRHFTIKVSGDTATDTIDSKLTIINDTTVEITNQDDVKLIIEPNTERTSGTLSYKNVTYATITETESGYLKIEYIDNTFEIY